MVAPDRGLAAPLDWERDGSDWPNREFSRFVTAGGLRWHVQQLGEGPQLLLVHGTGASTHSWRTLAPLLARHFAVTACDLPGHAFTSGTPPGGMSLTAMSAALTALVQALELQPLLAVGHSAGAAIVCRMSLDGGVAARGIVSLNGALLPMQPLQRLLFAPVAKVLASSSLSAKLFAWGARDGAAVDRLLAGTGSTLDERGVQLYRLLVRSEGHVDGALRMMAQWDIENLAPDLPRLAPPLTLLVGSTDRMVPPQEADRVQRLLPRAAVVSLQGLGHLAHEERPEAVAQVIIDAVAELR